MQILPSKIKVYPCPNNAINFGNNFKTKKLVKYKYHTINPPILAGRS